MEFENISRKVNDETGEMNIIVEFQKSKTSGVPQKSTALISGAIEIKILTEYENCFIKSEKKGRYFHKMKLGTNGRTILSTKAVLGHNTTAKTGIRIATALGLANPELYTGHTIRRTCATICAERGLQLAAIKQITGHKSDMVAQRYIDHSLNMKQGGADTLSLRGLQKDEHGVELRKRKRQFEVIGERRTGTGPSSGNNTTINFYNCADVKYNANRDDYEME